MRKLLILLLTALAVGYSNCQIYNQLSADDLAEYLTGMDSEEDDTDEDFDVESRSRQLTPKDLESEQDLGIPYEQYKFMSGGAGKQRVKPNNENETQKQEVKTDAALPAYCHPPNPCPKGYTAKDHHCQDKYFEESASFNQRLQQYKMEKGICACDEEHMFNCPRNADLVSSRKKPVQGEDDELTNAVLNYMENGGDGFVEVDEPYREGNKRETLVAKKSPHLSREKRSAIEKMVEEEEEPMNGEDLTFFENNPYLDVKEDERLPIVAKKAPPS